jgi:hypothetical protein
MGKIMLIADQETRCRVFMGLSSLVALLAVLLFTRNLGPSTLFISLIMLIIFILAFVLVYAGLRRVFHTVGNRTMLLWLGALGAAGLLALLLSPSVSAFFSTGPVPSPGTAGSFRLYDDPALGFRIAYPATWTPVSRKEPGSDIVTNTAFISRDGKTVATVQVTDLSVPEYRGFPLDIWTNHTLGVLASNALSSRFTLLGNERTELAGYPAQMLDYSVVLNSGDRIRTVMYLLEAGSKAYNVGFTSKEDTFNDMAETRQAVFSSFMVTG